MFTHQQIFQDFKENVKSSAPVKAYTHSRKGLASRSLNSFTDSTDVINSKKKNSETEAGNCQFSSEKKDNSKPKVNIQEIKANLHADGDMWSDIEEMHISKEPDDDYEDILPQCERMQKEDINALFLNYTYTRFTELAVDKLPSPIKEIKSLDFPEFSLPLPDVESSLFDDTALDFIPLSNNLFIE